MKILVSGGAGYIGSHTVLALLQAEHDVIVLDNLANSSKTSLERVHQLAGREVLGFEEVDLLDQPGLHRVFEQWKPQAVIHFAGLKAVGESNEKPLWYYTNNVGGTLNLLHAMEDSGCRTIVFSSSATVYGTPSYLPLDEAHPLRPESPYGRTKLQVEEMLGDLARSDPAWSIALLRYFNPVGSHDSGRIGEDPADIPNNLMPYVTQVATGRRPEPDEWCGATAHAGPPSCARAAQKRPPVGSHRRPLLCFTLWKKMLSRAVSRAGGKGGGHDRWATPGVGRKCRYPYV